MCGGCGINGDGIFRRGAAVLAGLRHLLLGGDEVREEWRRRVGAGADRMGFLIGVDNHQAAAGLTVVRSGAAIILPSHFRPPESDRW